LKSLVFPVFFRVNKGSFGSFLEESLALGLVIRTMRWDRIRCRRSEIGGGSTRRPATFMWGGGT